MTSHIISHFKRRAEALFKSGGSPSIFQLTSGQAEEVDCLFCMIVRGVQPCFKVYEDDWCTAFLDILPARPGHTLLVPKRHAARISHLDEESAAALGSVLPGLSRSICEATGQPDFNLVQNNGYAQVVDHVHFHIVPAPDFNKPQPKAQTFGDNRNELDEDEGAAMAGKIRACVERHFSARAPSLSSKM